VDKCCLGASCISQSYFSDGPPQSFTRQRNWKIRMAPIGTFIVFMLILWDPSTEIGKIVGIYVAQVCLLTDILFWGTIPIFYGGWMGAKKIKIFWLDFWHLNRWLYSEEENEKSKTTLLINDYYSIFPPNLVRVRQIAMENDIRVYAWSWSYSAVISSVAIFFWCHCRMAATANEVCCCCSCGTACHMTAYVSSCVVVLQMMM